MRNLGCYLPICVCLLVVAWQPNLTAAKQDNWIERNVAENKDTYDEGSGDTAPAYNPACPMPMCTEYCDVYAADEKGCMTCTCAEGSSQGQGENHVEKREHRECTSNQEWTECGSSCTPTCTNTLPACPRQCVPRCECPYNIPVWDGAQCIVAEQCQDRCTGGMVWTECGPQCTATCWEREPAACLSRCTKRCACPPQLPLWDDVMERCTDDMGCPVNNEKRENPSREEKIETLLHDLEELKRRIKEA